MSMIRKGLLILQTNLHTKYLTVKIENCDNSFFMPLLVIGAPYCNLGTIIHIEEGINGIPLPFLVNLC